MFLKEEYNIIVSKKTVILVAAVAVTGWLFGAKTAAVVATAVAASYAEGYRIIPG